MNDQQVRASDTRARLVGKQMRRGGYTLRETEEQGKLLPQQTIMMCAGVQIALTAKQPDTTTPDKTDKNILTQTELTETIRQLITDESQKN